jgi:hypothetical protein
LRTGTTRAQPQLDRDAEGVVRYGWKTRTQLLYQEPQNRWITSRRLNPEEALLNLRDVETGKTVLAHGGSVYWNAYRRRWVMIAVESYGSSSFLGEVWFAEADTPLGPWVYARKIVTHEKYSFYNPKQHPFFDKEDGRIIFFEGTYTTTFSGNPVATPRYDYNQVMYRLALSDQRLALPVPIYELPAGRDAGTRLVPKSVLADAESMPPRHVAFFAPDREGIASLPVYEHYDSQHQQDLRVGTSGAPPDGSGARPLFFVLPADTKDPTATTIPLYEHQDETTGRRVYSVAQPSLSSRSRGTARVLGRVWRNPARLRLW